MTHIIIDPRSIVLDGHAGKKTVCAALSALTETFLASMEQLTDDKIKSLIGEGYAEFRHKDLSEAGKLLRRSFLIGLYGVAAAAPDYITITQTER